MSIIIMILLISLLILVHEAGHFMAARMLGIKVSKFAIGFPIGPTLWSKKIGDVEYLIHACVLGGYVAFPDDDKDSDLPADSMDRFINRPVWQRMIVISAGVIANIITAFVLVFITAIAWGKLPSGQYQVYVNKISAPKEASIWQSGIQSGDRILKINGSEINSSYALTLYAQNSKSYDGKVDENFVNKNLTKLKTLNPSINENKTINAGVKIILPSFENEPSIKIEETALKGYNPYKDNQKELSESQIKLRDLLKDKKVYTADGNTTLQDIAYALSDNIRPLYITVLRGDKTINLPSVYADEKGIIGVMLENRQILMPTNTPKTIIKGTFDYIWDQTYMLCYGFYVLFAGKVPASSMHGIVAIAKVGGDVIQNNGIFSGLLLTAMISMDLAILNFLPIPALDGGHFMFLIIEKIRRKPVDEKTIEKISSIFFMLLIVLAFLIIFNDIYALLKHQL